MVTGMYPFAPHRIAARAKSMSLVEARAITGCSDANSDRSFNAFAHASLVHSIKESTTSPIEASWSWAPSSGKVAYVTTGTDNADCMLKREHSGKNGRPSITATAATAFTLEA